MEEFGLNMGCHQQLLYHLVFSTKERRALLQDDDFAPAFGNIWLESAVI